MATHFHDLNQLIGYLQACLEKAGGQYGDPKKLSDFRSAMVELIVLNQTKFTLTEVMTVLPEDMQLGQPRCTSEHLIPLLLALIREGGFLPAYFQWKFVLDTVCGDKESDGVSDSDTVKKSDDSTVVEQEDEVPENDAPVDYIKSIWYRLKEVDGFPTELKAIFEWLSKIPVSEELNWSGANGTMYSLTYWHRTHGSSYHLCKFLWALCPNWDGKGKIEKTDLRFEFDDLKIPMDQREGLTNFMMKMAIPGFIEVVKYCKLIK